MTSWRPAGTIVRLIRKRIQGTPWLTINQLDRRTDDHGVDAM
jgi:hypothetical protein